MLSLINDLNSRGSLAIANMLGLLTIAFCYCRYRVFLGSNQYFVASDVGSGKMQWYAFHKQAPMNDDPPGGNSLSLSFLLCSNTNFTLNLVFQCFREKGEASGAVWQLV